jgi:Domain of unknown function (DUF4294)
LRKEKRLRLVVSILLFVPALTIVSGQKDTARVKNDTLPDRFYVLQKVHRDGETLPEIEIKEVNIVGKRKLSSTFQYWRYERLVYNVRQVYPYAVLVRNKLDDINSNLEKVKGEKERKEYIRDVEKQVFKDYEGDMRDMTITQGRILIKLIDRETQNTSYDLIREYRGKLTASFWQGIARIFGTNLKEEYDPYGDDAVIEKIVEEIEAGRL